ncbi:MAG: transposase [Rhodospirillaceae bacterium]|nr:transposase [Rhodospirillaceae bacterium]
MPERRYREVQSRSQVMLLPPCLDDYVSEHNPVRAIDAFVGTLDLEALGFQNTEAHYGAGQPAYDPGLLLRLYLYGYQHRVRSSRRLEAETHRNLEVIWLCQGARPSYKTIADFRKDNLAALRATNREFVLLCRELSLLGDSRVAIDGAFLKANASPGSIHTKARLEKDLKKLDERIAAYHRQLDEADADPKDGADGGEDPELAAKIEAMVKKQKHRKALQERLLESGESQVSEVDPDARTMKKYGKSVGGYNCQIAVDDKHKLIVAEDVVQDGNDSGQYEPMMTKACEATGNPGLIGLADVGYWSGAQLKECEDRGMDVYVPIPTHLQCKRPRPRSLFALELLSFANNGLRLQRPASPFPSEPPILATFRTRSYSEPAGIQSPEHVASSGARR